MTFSSSLGKLNWAATGRKARISYYGGENSANSLSWSGKDMVEVRDGITALPVIYSEGDTES